MDIATEQGIQTAEGQKPRLSFEAAQDLRLNITRSLGDAAHQMNEGARSSQDIARTGIAQELGNVFLAAYDIATMQRQNPWDALNSMTVSLGELPLRDAQANTQFAAERQHVRDFWETAWPGIVNAEKQGGFPRETFILNAICYRVMDVMDQLSGQDPYKFLQRVTDHLRAAKGPKA